MKTVRTRFFLSLLALILAIPAIAVAAEQAGPMERVEAAVDAIVDTLLDESKTWEQRQSEISELADELFDYRAMSQSALATNWRRASTQQQNEFERLFSQLLENTYIDRLRAYSGETVEYREEEIDGRRADVETLVISDSGRIPVNYKMWRRSDGWFVYDVEVDSISLIASYRETYRSIVNRSGMDGLLQQLRERAAEVRD